MAKGAVIETSIESLEPAIAGPPSPERLRQLSKQMKRASHLNRRTHGHRAATSSTSSSIYSSNGDRPVWEQTLEHMSLSRRPSDRSNRSSTLSRERPESMFGKSFFQRKGRSTREGSSHSSSGASWSSGESPPELTHGRKDSFVPTIFARRKPSRDETLQRKLQISGPFNFQHVSHTHSDNYPEVTTRTGMELSSTLQAMHTPGPTSAPTLLGAGETRNTPNLGHFSQASSGPLTAPLVRPSLVPHHTAPAAEAWKLMKPTRSQDYLRGTSNRLIRHSATRSGADRPTSPPLPSIPPRTSSRQSLRNDDFTFGAFTSFEHPPTASSFCKPRPFSPLAAESPAIMPAMYHSLPPTPMASDEFGDDFEEEDSDFSNVLGQSESGSWPLPSTSNLIAYDKALPDVPEEEEQQTSNHRPTLSAASTQSSLRGSYSVPMLRSFVQAQRPPSSGSDTLGRFGPADLHVHPQDGEQDLPINDRRGVRESWEDDIDYCYEHEAEASCDYQWNRSSVDKTWGVFDLLDQIDAIDDEAEVAASEASIAESATTALLKSHSLSTPNLLAAVSAQSEHTHLIRSETSKSAANLTITSNFSLPRAEKHFGRPAALKLSRPLSTASSFKESQGFTLSPSLLIPQEYQDGALQSNVTNVEDAFGNNFNSADNKPMHLEGHIARVHGRSPLALQRSSTSTTESSSDGRSDSTGGRHVSANSAYTSITRLTASTSSLNKVAGFVIDPVEPMPSTDDVDCIQGGQVGVEEEETPPATTDSVSDLVSFPILANKGRGMHKSHASESIVRDELKPMRSFDARTRRPRARTTSISVQAPPVGQYALFPKSSIKATGDRF